MEDAQLAHVYRVRTQHQQIGFNWVPNMHSKRIYSTAGAALADELQAREHASERSASKLQPDFSGQRRWFRQRPAMAHPAIQTMLPCEAISLPFSTSRG
jgi:hypothetical protein